MANKRDDTILSCLIHRTQENFHPIVHFRQTRWTTNSTERLH